MTRQIYVFMFISLLCLAIISCMNINSKSALAYSTDKHTTIYPSSYFPMEKIDRIVSSAEYMVYISEGSEYIEMLVSKENENRYSQKKFRKSDIGFVNATEEIYYYVVRNALVILVVEKSVNKPPKRFYTLQLDEDTVSPNQNVGIELPPGDIRTIGNIVSNGNYFMVTDQDKNVYKYEYNQTEKQLNVVKRMRYVWLRNVHKPFSFIGEKEYYYLEPTGNGNDRAFYHDLKDFTSDNGNNSRTIEFSDDLIENFDFFDNLFFENYLFLRNADGKSFKLLNTKNTRIIDLLLDEKKFESPFSISNQTMTVFENKIHILKNNEVVSYSFDTANGNMTRDSSLSNKPNENDIQSFDHIVRTDNNFYVADNVGNKIYKVSVPKNDIQKFTKTELIDVKESVTHMNYNGITLEYSTINKIYSINWITKKHELVLELKTEEIISFILIGEYKYILTKTGLYKYNSNNKKEEIDRSTKYKRMTSMQNGKKLYLLRDGYIDILDTSEKLNPIIKKVSIGTIDATKQISMTTDGVGNIYLLKENGTLTKIKDVSYTKEVTSYNVKGIAVGSEPKFTDIAIHKDDIFLSTKNYLATYSDKNNKIKTDDTLFPNAVSDIEKIENKLREEMIKKSDYTSIKFFSCKDGKELFAYKLNNTNDDIIRINKNDVIMTFGYQQDEYLYGVLNGIHVRFKHDLDVVKEIDTTYYTNKTKKQIKANCFGKINHTDKNGTKEFFSGAVVDCILTCSKLKNLCYVKDKTGNFSFVEENNLTPVIEYKESQTKGKGIIQSKEIGKRVPLYSEASDKSEIKDTLVDGTTYKLIEEDNDFYKVLITKKGKNKTNVYGYVLKTNTISKGLTHTQILIIIVSILGVIGLTVLILTSIASKKRY